MGASGLFFGSASRGRGDVRRRGQGACEVKFVEDLLADEFYEQELRES